MTTTTTRHATVPCPFCGTLNRVDLARVDDRPKCGAAACARPILLDRPVALHDRDFDRVIAGTDVPVLVDFYADWCGPCKMMAPVLDQLAGELKGHVVVAKLDTDREQGVAAAFQIRSIPTLIAFQGGAPVATQMGAVPKARLLEMLRQAGAAI